MSLDLNLTESEEMLKKTAMDFMSRDAPKQVIKALQESDTGYTEELWRKAAELGWLGIIIPERYGGTGGSFTSAGVLFEALGSGPLPGPHFSSGILGSLVVLECGNEEQHQQILPQVASGEYILTLALTEPDYGWESGTMRTFATRKNGGFMLNGLKLFTFDAQAATHLIVCAHMRGDGVTGEGVSLFVVDRKSIGVSVRRVPGYFAGTTYEVRLDDVKVPESAMLGGAADRWPALEQAINKSIPILCAYKVGGCQEVFEIAREYSRSRVQFGQAIGRFQRVQDLIIDIAFNADAARWTTYEALWKVDTNRTAIESAHLAKAVSSEAYWQACTLAHRVLSGIGLSREHPVSFHTRASRSLYHYLGEPSYHRRQLAQLLMA